jgi:hypothetical protein
MSKSAPADSSTPGSSPEIVCSDPHHLKAKQAFTGGVLATWFSCSAPLSHDSLQQDVFCLFQEGNRPTCGPEKRGLPPRAARKVLSPAGGSSCVDLDAACLDGIQSSRLCVTPCSHACDGVQCDSNSESAPKLPPGGVGDAVTFRQAWIYVCKYSGISGVSVTGGEHVGTHTLFNPHPFGVMQDKGIGWNPETARTSLSTRVFPLSSSQSHAIAQPYAPPRRISVVTCHGGAGGT